MKNSEEDNVANGQKLEISEKIESEGHCDTILASKLLSGTGKSISIKPER